MPVRRPALLLMLVLMLPADRCWWRRQPALEGTLGGVVGGLTNKVVLKRWGETRASGTVPNEEVRSGSHG